MQALYRKYRSTALSEIVGQEHVTTTLANAIAQGRISHAYLFTGPHGVGKTSVARILAHEINKLTYSEKTHLDIIEIDAASNRRIDDIRDLRDKVHIAPVAATYKVYIIDEVHMLTGESFNALLKTLEEPPSHVVFILATTEAHKLPATIISRTQRYSFRAADPEKLVPHLRHIAAQEKIEITNDALQLIAEHGGGSFRDSISLLDQLANISKGKIDAKNVEQNLGLAPKAALHSLVEALRAHDITAITKQLNELEQVGVTSTALVPQLLRALQQLAPKNPSLYVLVDQLLEVPRAYDPQLKLLTTLVRFGLSKTTSAPAPKTSAALAAPPKAIAEIGPKPIPITKPASATTPPSPEAMASSSLTELTNEQWAAVLGKIKSLSPPLHGVLKHAQPAFEAKTQTLTLKCAYQLHRKKLDDSKAKAEIARACAEALGGAPIIKTELDQQAKAPDVSSVAPAPKPIDDASKSVIDLMGGGEMV